MLYDLIKLGIPWDQILDHATLVDRDLAPEDEVAWVRSHGRTIRIYTTPYPPRYRTIDLLPVAPDIEGELDRARNVFGKLDEPIRQRIRDVIAEPTQETWHNAYSIIIGADARMTVWQAVRQVDRWFPSQKPSTYPWPQIPTRYVLVEALRFATK